MLHYHAGLKQPNGPDRAYFALAANSLKQHAELRLPLAALSSVT